MLLSEREIRESNARFAAHQREEAIRDRQFANRMRGLAPEPNVERAARDAEENYQRGEQARRNGW